MISESTKNQIYQSIAIEDVIGDYVSLKKRGANSVALCPFHNEKTPSFHVNAAKGIYKCFGCGAGGNAVNFVMEHDQCTYPEALKYLAQKYHIEIEEKMETEEEVEARNERESIFIINSFAQKYFTDLLLNSDEGKSIGLSYFKERGYNEDTIEKFQLGYSLDKWDAFTKEALGQSYQLDYLERAGLTIAKEKGDAIDRFRGRVMIPIHNLSGRVIAFGGRILKEAKNTGKYINSPETDIYHKSKVLYGAYFAKKAINAADNCLLVEGYTDVISLFQEGIENVVSSSGTSLTSEQIRLIRRFTNNITILYDGDEAGEKASLRGMDMILEEGMNVRIVLFPDKEDPDSYVRKVGGNNFKSFIKSNARDFIHFKADLLLKDAGTDTVNISNAITDIVTSISKISDPIKRALYLKDCSKIFEIGEKDLVSKLSAIIKKSSRKPRKTGDLKKDAKLVALKNEQVSDEEVLEKYVLKLLLKYPQDQIIINENDKEAKSQTCLTAKYIIEELKGNGIDFDNQIYNKIIEEIESLLLNDNKIDQQVFMNHHNPDVSKLTVDLLASRHEVSENWEKKKDILVPEEESKLKNNVVEILNRLKLKKVKKMILENQQKLKDPESNQDHQTLLQVHSHLTDLQKQLAEPLGIVVNG